MIDFLVAYDKLASLESADEIANLMLDYGVKAVPSDSQSCAVSVWMTEQTGLAVATNCSVVREVAMLTAEEVEWDYTGLGYKDIPDTPNFKAHTPAMREFIDKFDTRKYPNLIKGGC